MWNLLNDPLIQVRMTSGQTAGCTLPAALDALFRDRIDCFRHLAPHQKGSWHVFLVQLAALALAGRAPGDFPAGPRQWRHLLRRLTPDHPLDRPWQLVTEDTAAPAFLQPPAPGGPFSGGRVYHYPDDIDVLISARNHDLKQHRVRHPAPDHWLFALLSLQTTQGFLGYGNYGISRMNGGFNNRAVIGLAPGPRWGERFRRDLKVLLLRRDDILAACPHYRPDGPALLWLLPWDGGSSLPINGLHPYYIEICRRVRLVSRQGRISARCLPSQAPRLAAAHLRGDTGDPWTTVSRRGSGAVTIDERGFSCEVLPALFFHEDYRRGICQELLPDEQPETLFLSARTLVRGRGKTAGLKDRWVAVPREAQPLVRDPDKRQALGAAARMMADQVKAVEHKALKPALLKLLQRGSNRLNFQDRRTEFWLADFEKDVDEKFFPHLWRLATRRPRERERSWLAFLESVGRQTLSRAERALPGCCGRVYRARAQSFILYEGVFRKHFQPD